MASFNPERLTIARRRRGLSKTELAQLAGVTSRVLTDHEGGKKVPGPDTIAKFSAVLNFPIEFFSGGRIELMDEENVSFRSLKSMTAWQRDSALAACSIALELNEWIEKRFSLPAPDLPAFDDATPEEAAVELRAHWGLGLLPVKNMIHLLESRGVRVFSLSEKSREVDAFSFWKAGKPFCFLNTMKSAEHSRFDAAHELGHLVLHRHAAPNGRGAEREADAFASAFLMPRETVRAHVKVGATRPELIAVKHRWRVSLAALANRSHRVGLLSDWHYRGLCIEMGQRGDRTTEPRPMATRETSQVLAKVFTALRDDGITRSAVASELAIERSELDSLIFGLMLVSVDRDVVTEHAPTPKRPPTGLRLAPPPNR
jgi:Zn-dependent peptidase ImmA (M78 family)/DNA-binding XRE family transcriptional regulator